MGGFCRNKIHILLFINADSELKQPPSKWDLILDVANTQKRGLKVRGGGSDLVYRNPKRLKLGTQKAVRKRPRKGDVKGTKLSPQSQQEKKIPLRLLHPLIFNFPVLHLMPFFKNYFFFFPLLRAPTSGAGWHPGSCTQKSPSSPRGLSGTFFSLRNHLVYRKNTVGLVFYFPPWPPLTALHPTSSQGAWKCGCSSWRAHRPFDRSCRGNSAHTPADVWVWNKSGSLAPRWLASVGLRGVESSKISFQSIKICRDIWNVQREQISRVNQSND